jgi:flagellar biosynthesis protein FlhB
VSEAAEKPFEATPQRIAKAKRDGNVARSNELSANVAFAAAATAAIGLVPLIGAFARAALTSARFEPPWTASALLAVVSLLPLVCSAVAALAAAAMQNGGIAVVTVAAKLERLDPTQGFKRMFSRETLGHGLRALAAVALITLAIVPTIATRAVQITSAATLDEVAAGAWQAARHVAFSACIIGGIFAISEHVFARRAWLQKLRMSFDERRREAKEQEGDPIERGRRRTLHRTLLRGAVSSVKSASFVVANPTHVAVALEYRPPEIGVPRILVLAAGEAARRVVVLALEYRIPVVQNAALARALHRDGRVGETISAAHFVAVAEVVAALQRSGKLDA